MGIGNLFMIFNAYSVKRNVDNFGVRVTAKQATCCYRIVRV